MSTYLPALIWSLSSLVCLVIAGRRRLEKTAFRMCLATLAGPLALPFVLRAKPWRAVPA